MVEESPLLSPARPPFQCSPSRFFAQVSNQGIYKTVRIRADFVTLQSRLESFRDWPHATLPPLELALAGFYHDSIEGDSTTISCFSCGVVWPRATPSGQYSKKEMRTIYLDYHVDNCLWAEMLRSSFGTDLYELQADMEDAERQSRSGQQCNTMNNDKSNVNFSIQINRAGTGRCKAPFQILDMLLSQNCAFSFTCNSQ
jgi:hypothetical protein